VIDAVAVADNYYRDVVGQEELQSHSVVKNVVSWHSRAAAKEHGAGQTHGRQRTILRFTDAAFTADSTVSAWKYCPHRPQSSKELAVSLSWCSCP